MSWPPWPIGNYRLLARYVTRESYQWLALPSPAYDLALSPEGRRRLVGLLYDEVRRHEIDYQLEPASPPQQQEVRTPEEIFLSERQGTCLDLALLFCGFCLRCDLRPFLVLVEGHAFVLVSLLGRARDWEKEKPTNQPLPLYLPEGTLPGGAENAERLRERFIDEGNYIALECTGFARTFALPPDVPEGAGRGADGLLTFEQALAAGRAQLSYAARPFRCALDIVRLQLQLGYPPYERGEETPGIGVAKRVEEIVREHTTRFVGRAQELEAMDALLRRPSGALLVVGRGGFGKTALLSSWLRRRAGGRGFVAYHFFSALSPDTCVPVNFYRNLLRQIYTYYRRDWRAMPADEVRLHEALVRSVTEWLPRGDQPLVLLLDGLDQIDNQKGLPWPFPGGLPEGVFVIASARSFGEPPAWLQTWLNHAESPDILNGLRNLDETAVADYQRAAGGGELAGRAQGPSWVRRVMDVTEGYPLHLKYLTDELVAAASDGRDVETLLQETPTGFAKYIKQQLAELEARPLPDKALSLFYLLMVVKGRISGTDMVKVLGIDHERLAKFRSSWHVTRWLEITSADNVLYSFQHPLLAELFADAAAEAAAAAAERLLDYCAQWEKTASPYALRHYPAHLLEAREHGRLVALALNEKFLDGQARAFPSEPLLPLRTLGTGRQVAAAEDDAAALASLTLCHAHRVFATEAYARQEAEQGDPFKALAVLELYDPLKRVIWSLLLAWKLREQNQPRAARAALEDLASLPVPPQRGSAGLSQPGGEDDGWEGEYIAYLLAQVAGIDRAACAKIRRFLDGPALLSLANHLLNVGEHTAAFEALTDARLASPPAVQLQPEQAEAEDGTRRWRDALLLRALRERLSGPDAEGADAFVEHIQTQGMRALAHIFLADHRLDQDPKAAPSALLRAEEEVGRIDNIDERIGMLFRIFWIRLRLGDVDAIRSFLDRVREEAAQRGGEAAYVAGLMLLIDYQLAHGQKEAARRQLARSAEQAAGIKEPERRLEALLQLASRQTRAHDRAAAEGALLAVEKLAGELTDFALRADALTRAGALWRLARRRRRSDEVLDSAEESARLIPEEAPRLRALLTVAGVRARVLLRGLVLPLEGEPAQGAGPVPRGGSVTTGLTPSPRRARREQAAQTLKARADELLEGHGPGVRVNVWCWLAERLSQAGCAELAAGALGHARADAVRARSREKVEALFHIATTSPALGEPDAVTAWRDVLDAITDSDDHAVFKNLHYEQLARRAAQAGSHEVMTRALEAGGGDYGLRLVIARLQATRGEKEAAQLTLMRGLGRLPVWSTDNGPVHVLAGFALLLSSEGKTEGASLCFDDALEAAKSQTSPRNHAVVTWEVGEYMAAAGYTQEAELTFRRALSLVDSLPSESEKFFSLRRVLGVQLNNPLPGSFAYTFFNDLTRYSGLAARVARLQLEAVIHGHALRTAQAEESFAKAVEAAEGLEKYELIDVLVENAVLQAQRGLGEAAKTSLARALGLAKEPPPDSATQDRIALTYAWIGEHELAFETFNHDTMRTQYAFWALGLPELSGLPSKNGDGDEGSLRALQRRVLLAFAEGNVDDSVSGLKQVFDDARKAGSHWDGTRARLAVALAQARRGETGEAVNTLRRTLLGDPPPPALGTDGQS